MSELTRTGDPTGEREISQGGGVGRWLGVAALNLLILAELTWSMYFSHGAGEDMAWVFLRSFLPLALGTLVMGRFLLRRFFAA